MFGWRDIFYKHVKYERYAGFSLGDIEFRNIYRKFLLEPIRRKLSAQDVLRGLSCVTPARTVLIFRSGSEYFLGS